MGNLSKTLISRPQCDIKRSTLSFVFLFLFFKHSSEVQAYQAVRIRTGQCTGFGLACITSVSVLYSLWLMLSVVFYWYFSFCQLCIKELDKKPFVLFKGLSND